ncbi:DCN1-like protein 4 [Thoreauomyces humboldtii]|nr:DCN1-like protein 4 [Thoreauomyces humboldtii]
MLIGFFGKLFSIFKSFVSLFFITSPATTKEASLEACPESPEKDQTCAGGILSPAAASVSDAQLASEHLMPPKRKTSTASTTAAARAKKTKTEGVMSAKLRTRATSAKSAKSESSYNVRKCGTWFQTYEDVDDKGVIGPDGIERLCADLGIDVTSMEILVVAWRLRASRMGFFTKNEWLDGMRTLEVDSTESLQALLPSFRAVLDLPAEYKDLYMFAFSFAKEEDQKSLNIDVSWLLANQATFHSAYIGKLLLTSLSLQHAKGMWTLLCPEEKFEHITPFLEFLNEKNPVKVINRDQWRSFLEFSNTVKGDLTGYDESSAWPVLLDEYVAWKRSKA